MIDADAVVEIGARLRIERERLGLSQAALAQNTGVSKLTQLKYESAQSHPNAPYLASIAKLGGDVLFVITGERRSEWFESDPLRRAVLNSFEQCSPEKQIEAVQYMALLAAGVAQTPSGSAPTSNVTKAKVSKSIFGFAGNVVGKK